MSIILHAWRQRAVRANQEAPWSATLHGYPARRPPGAAVGRHATLLSLTVGIGASMLVWGGRESRAVADSSPHPRAQTVEQAEIPMLQPLPRVALERTVAASGAASVVAVAVESRAAMSMTRTPFMAGPATAAPAQPARLPPPPPTLPVTALTSLSAPLPPPGGALPPGTVPGRVPPPPGLGMPPIATVATAAPKPAAAEIRQLAPPATVPALRPASAFQALDELPPALRDAIEGVRIQLHLYAPVSRQRWLLVAGKRVKEGDELVEGVRLEEITPQGLVLSQGPQRFQVKTSALQGRAA